MDSGSTAHLLLLLLQRLGALHLGEHLLRARPLLRRAVGRQVLQVRHLLPPLRNTYQGPNQNYDLVRCTYGSRSQRWQRSGVRVAAERASRTCTDDHVMRKLH